MTLKIADFGIAYDQILNKSSTVSANKQTLLQLVGTLDWMSPELRNI